MLNWLSYFYYLSETNKWEQTPPLPQYPLSSPKHVRLCDLGELLSSLVN